MPYIDPDDFSPIPLSCCESFELVSAVACAVGIVVERLLRGVGIFLGRVSVRKNGLTSSAFDLRVFWTLGSGLVADESESSPEDSLELYTTNGFPLEP